MKKIIFLLIATLLVLGLVLPGCAGSGGGGDGGEDTRSPVTFAIAGPMTEMQGESHQWWGAELARDEINTGTGVNVGGVYHKIALVQVATNEISGTPEEGVAALQAVIDDVDFVLGGSNGESVVVYREVAMDAKKIFMNCGIYKGSLQYSVVADYDTYKYWFSGNIYNDCFLLTSLFKMTGTIGTVLKQTLEDYGNAVAEDYRVPEDGKLRVAMLAEDVAWCNGICGSAHVNLPGYGYTSVGKWLISPTATDISTELTEIAAAKPHVIFTVFGGSVAVTYSKQRVELEIPAMTIGINAEGQQKGHWTNTEGKCNGEIMLDAWAEGLQNTAKTTAFLNAFMVKTGEYPYGSAATYNAIYSLKEAIEAVSAAHDWDDIADVVAPDNIDALVQYIETSSYTGTGSKSVYYPVPAFALGDGIYALSEAQVRALYDLDSYGKTYVQDQWRISPTGSILGEPLPNIGGHMAHDKVYGPGYDTSIGSQWQDGHKVGVWPIDLGDDYDEAFTDQYGCWNFEYPGTTDVVIPIEGFLVS